MYVEGVAYNALNAGASSKPPEPRIATPAAVPLVSSSNFDCSQVRVPSASPAGTNIMTRKMGRAIRTRIKSEEIDDLRKSLPLGVMLGRMVQIITSRGQHSRLSATGATGGHG